MKSLKSAYLFFSFDVSVDLFNNFYESLCLYNFKIFLKAYNINCNKDQGLTTLCNSWFFTLIFKRHLTPYLRLTISSLLILHFDVSFGRKIKELFSSWKYIKLDTGVFYDNFNKEFKNFFVEKDFFPFFEK